MLPLPPTPPSASTTPDWQRKVAGLINGLLGRSVLRDGATTYTAPTAAASYDQAQVQALMNAVEVLSDRLK